MCYISRRRRKQEHTFLTASFKKQDLQNSCRTIIMNTFVFALVLFAATNVLGQGYNEYVDEALIQRVGKIVYEYDQQQRSGGGVGSSNNVDFGRSVGRVSGGGYQQQQRVNSYVPQQQQRNVYQSNRGQRQLSVPVQQQQVYQPQAPVPVARTYPAPQAQSYRYEAPRTRPVTREYVEPQQSFSGYTLSEPEVVPRVAEFHFTEDDGPQRSQNYQMTRAVSGVAQQRNGNQFMRPVSGVEQQRNNNRFHMV